VFVFIDFVTFTMFGFIDFLSEIIKRK